MTDKPKVGDAIDGKEVTGVFYPWVKFGNVCGSGWVKVDNDVTDKLNEGDVIDVDAINEIMKKVKLLKPPIKPLDVNGNKYYFWIQGEDGGWIPSDDPGAREALLGVIGEDWFYEDSKNE